MFRKMRRFKQEVTKEACIQILKNEKRATLAVLGDDGYPYAIPINFWYDEEEEKIFFHCAKEGHKLDAMRANDKICFTTWDAGELKDDWGLYVTSVVVFGRAKPVTDEARAYEKARTFALKYFPTAEEVDENLASGFNRMQLIEISIDHMTGKYVHEK